MTAAPAARPSWVDDRLYPFEDRWLEVAGARVHYVDEGSGPPLLMLHGNPTWSFLYREIISGLRDRFRCVALDYPGFGLSTAPRGYRFTAAEHAAVVEAAVRALDLRDVTLMVQDWGGPIGFWVAGREPERFSRFVIGNTWAWTMTGRGGAWAFSKFMGGPVGRRLILNRNVFVERILGQGVRRRKLPEDVMAHYRGPFPTPASRVPVAVLPREILAATPFLAEVELRLQRFAGHPALLVWPDKDPAFRDGERLRWEALFHDHRTVMLPGAGHYIQEEAPAEIVEAIRAWA